MNEIVNFPEVLRSDPITLETEKLYISLFPKSRDVPVISVLQTKWLFSGCEMMSMR